MVKRALVIAVILGSFAALVGGCGSDNGTNGDVPEPYNTLRFDFYTVAVLSDAMHYELWVSPIPEELAAAEDGWVSLGKFNVVLDDGTLTMVDLDGNPITDNTLQNLPGIELTDYDSFFVTIEPANDTDTLPSASVYLAGDIDFEESHFVGMEFPHTQLGLLNENAYYTYATPTDADSDSLNDLSGVWFMLAQQTTGLFDLPSAPDGWLYQGWVQYRVEKEGPDDIYVLTTGRFAERDEDDMDAFYSASTNPPPGFPGEDFLTSSPSAELEFPAGAPENVWISVEPYPDPDPATPFPYMIYEMQAGQTPEPQRNYQLDRKDKSTNDFPNASVFMSRGTGD